MLSDAVKFAMCERSLSELSNAANTQAAEDKATIATLRAEVERLSNANDQVWADNERLRAALEQISAEYEMDWADTVEEMNRFARAALAEEKPND